MLENKTKTKAYEVNLRERERELKYTQSKTTTKTSLDSHSWAHVVFYLGIFVSFFCRSHLFGAHFINKLIYTAYACTFFNPNSLSSWFFSISKSVHFSQHRMRLCLSGMYFFSHMCMHWCYFSFFFPVCQMIWLYSFCWHFFFHSIQLPHIFILLMHAPFVCFRYSIPFLHCRDKTPNIIWRAFCMHFFDLDIRAE